MKLTDPEAIAALSPEARRALLADLLRRQDAGPAAPRRSDYERYVNPHLGALLRAGRLDRTFVRGEGCRLWDADDRAYLDFTAAYGALPFGFNPPQIWAAIRRVEETLEPSFTQPSAQGAAGELARRLLAVAPAGFETVTYANSGAEAVEAAIKMARSAKRRPLVVSTLKGFHGKTLGALSASMRPHYQDAFYAPVPGFLAAPFGDVEALAALFAAHRGEIAAFLVEPIQGEGGVFQAPLGYLRSVRELCDRHDVAMIVDEVQTGLGRTGRLFAIEAEGIVPDIMTLAKALGGGLTPMAAVLARSSVYSEDFALKHTSTFAANTLGCRVGLAVLDLLAADGGALVASVAENGARLKAGLQELVRKFAPIVREVRGEGYLLGLEFSADYGDFDHQGVTAGLAVQESLVLTLACWLLEIEGVRVMPTVFENRVLRIEPALIAGPLECDAFLQALERGLEMVTSCDAAALTGHLAGRQERRVRRRPAAPAVARPRPDERRWGFVVHPLDLASYRDMDATLDGLDDAQLGDVVERLNDSRFVGVARSLVVGSARVTSPTGATAFGELIAIPRTAEEMLAMPVAEASGLVREAVDLARDRGAEIVGLGGFTSIVTANGLDLAAVGVPLTTGNGYTAVNSAQTVLAALSSVGLEPADATVAIVGAAGAVGRACALLLAPTIRRLIFVGNPKSGAAGLSRLEAAAEAVREAHRGELGHLEIEASLDLAASLQRADAVVTATSHTGSLLTADMARPGLIVCDTARPSNIDASVIRRPDVLAVDGGLVSAGFDRSRTLRYGLNPGVTYACMAETFLLALDGDLSHGSLGVELSRAHLARLEAAAENHGFRMAPLQVGAQVISPAKFAEVRASIASRSASVSRSVGAAMEAEAQANR